MNQATRRRAGGSGGWLAVATISGAAAALLSGADGVGRAQPADSKRPVGWLATYLPQGVKLKGPGEVRWYVPAAAMALRPGESVHPAVAAPGLTAIYDALVTIEAPGKYRFGAEFEGGTAEVRIFGGALLEPVIQKLGSSGAMTAWIDLPAGPVNVQYNFSRRADSAARLRALWSKQGIGEDGFRPEALPVGSVHVPPVGVADARAAMAVERGRVLLGNLGCIQCHQLTEGIALKRPPPLAEDAAKRLSPDWIKSWIADPQSVKPGCGMPGVLSGPTAADEANSITQFLASVAGGPAVTLEASAPGDKTAEVAEGRTIFQQRGCVACHGVLEAAAGAPAPESYQPWESIKGLGGKWMPGALAEFLRDPLRSHPGGRMPSLDLSQHEAAAVASYLLEAWGPGPVQAAKDGFLVGRLDEVQAGRAAFAARGCANCHTTGAPGTLVVASTLKARPLNELRTTSKTGCLSATDKKSPRYTLSQDDRAALVAAIDAAKKWLGPKGEASLASAPLDRAHLTVGALGCANCHEVDGEGGIAEPLKQYFVTLGEADLGDEGRFPPRLTDVGAKLTTEWLGKVMTESGRARPYLSSRMPQFGKEQVGALPVQLASAAGVWPTAGLSVKERSASDQIVQDGRQLVGVLGLNCISCHVVGDHPAAGTPGPDIAAFTERIRYDWWLNYVFAPERYKPGTKMPSFYKRGVATITDVAGGDPSKQVDAIWAYFGTGPAMPLPEGITQPEGLRLTVGERPIVMRTFLKDAGSRGIAIGFPASAGGVHFALDAENSRLVEAWSGDFLDATNVWAGRGGNVVGGQGPVIWRAPAGPALVIGESLEGRRPTQTGRDAGWSFRGYRLDHDGVPTFMYRAPAGGANGAAAAADVMERIEPTGRGSEFRRTFEIRGLSAGTQVWVNGGPGAVVSAVANVALVAGRERSPAGFEVKDALKPAVFAVVVKP